jgi:two-component system sensor histidine kinase/response regulator
MDSINSVQPNNLNDNNLNAFLNPFFNITDVGFVFAGQKMQIIEVNRAFTDFSGYVVDEIKGLKIVDLIEKSSHPALLETFENLEPSGKKEMECLFKTKNRGSVFVLLKIFKLQINDDPSLGLVIQFDFPSALKNNESGHNGSLRAPSDLESTISKFSTLIDNSRDVLYSIYYKDFKFEYLSPSVVELTGFTRDELISMTPRQMLKIIHPDYRRTYLRYWNSLKLNINRENHTIEYKIRPKLGISRWLSDNHKVISDEKGKIIKLVGNTRDITDFKLVEEALNRSRDRLFKAIEATNDGMWDWRVSANKVYFDARFYTMLGYEPLEFPAVVEEWMKRIHPDDIDDVRALFDRNIDGNSNQWMVEYRFLAKDGSWVWISNRGKVFERDDSGMPLRIVGTHSDISLQKKAEEELQKRNEELQTIYEQLQISEEKFRQLAENTLDVFWLRDEDKIIYINSTFEKVWGRNRDEVFQNPRILKEWVYPEDQDQFVAWITFPLFENQNFYVEKYRIVKPDGEIRWIWSRMFPVYNDKHQLYRLAGIASDITDQKLVEEALIAAKEKAMESDQLKSAFLANISHEIRTPMNGIIGFAELLKDDHLTSENRIQYVNVITKSSEQLLHIIDDIIDISKIEANQLKINYVNVRIGGLLAELQLFYENEKTNLGKNDIEIKAEVPQILLNSIISTDESRLRQILMNLVSNALKFTDKGHVKFGFSVRPDNFIEFYVTDTGIGIPIDRQYLIFKRFRQLDETLTRKFGGTGLGLAICEGLVKLLGGQIWVKSEPGNGSTFFFTIPTGNGTSKRTTARKEVSNVGDYDWSGKTILVVEDDEINLEFLLAVLSPTNAKLISSTTGEDAVSVCEINNNLDIVLMDIRLPQMNGYEAFEKIRKIHPSLPVIAQTAFAMTEDATRCLEFGFDDYIPKPISRKNLLSMINKLLYQPTVGNTAD